VAVNRSAESMVVEAWPRNDLQRRVFRGGHLIAKGDRRRPVPRPRASVEPATRHPARAGDNYRVCGVRIAALTPLDAAEQIARRAAAGESVQTHLCNAFTLSLVDTDTRLAAALALADLNLPDGTPVAWLGRGHGLRQPVRGPALVGDTVDVGRQYGLRHFLLGGAPGVADAMATQLQAHAPGTDIVGTESPPFCELDPEYLRGAATRIQACRANVVWIGLGTPLQDYLVPRLAREVTAAIVPVGAAFDFWAGTVTQAPEWMHGTGLEWLHRLGTEPQRLWRRYLIGNPRFIVSAVKHGRRPACVS